MIETDTGRIVVTGAAGFLGQHVIRHLLTCGKTVLAVVLAGDDETRLQALNLGVDFSVVPSPLTLGETVKELEPAYVIHLGAIIDNRPALEAVQKTLTANLLSTLSLLEALTATSVKRVILLGSCEEYGNNPTPFQTDQAVDPVTPYAASKAAMVAYARMFYSAFGLPAVILRPAVIYGFGQNPRMLITDVMASLEAGMPVGVSPGEQERDFLYISDMVDAIASALHAPGIDGRTLNVGTGTVFTVRQCVEEIEAITGRVSLVNWGARPYAKNEVFHYSPDCSLTEAALGWKAKIGLRQGLTLMLEKMRASLRQQETIGVK